MRVDCCNVFGKHKEAKLVNGGYVCAAMSILMCHSYRRFYMSWLLINLLVYICPCFCWKHVSNCGEQISWVAQMTMSCDLLGFLSADINWGTWAARGILHRGHCQPNHKYMLQNSPGIPTGTVRSETKAVFWNQHQLRATRSSPCFRWDYFFRGNGEPLFH